MRLANLAGGTSTAGTTVVMANASGVLVSNAVGDGLEISSGQLQVRQDSSANGVNLQTVTHAGNTTTYGATFGATTTVGTPDDSSAAGKGHRFSIGGAANYLLQVPSTTSAASESFRLLRGTEENIIFKASGSSRFKGDAKIAATAAGDGNDTFGVHLRNDGLLTAYKGTTTGNSPVALFKSNVGGLASENARINADGSAVFADNNITLAANGSATFKGTYLVLGNIFNSADNNTGTTVYQGFVRAKRSSGADGADSLWEGYFGTGATPTSKITCDGTVHVKKIQFPAGSDTATKTVDNNTLDDYEEGTFTPSWSVSAGTAPTSGTAAGWYTKIGNRVMFTLQIDTNQVANSNTGHLVAIGGLPFQVNGTVTGNPLSIAVAYRWATDMPLSAYTAGANNNIYLGKSKTDETGTWERVDTADMTQGNTAAQNSIRISGVYVTSS